MAQAKKWAEEEIDLQSRTLLERKLVLGDVSFIRECFELPLTFGTAGLRGRVGIGPAHLGASLVAKVSWALSRHLKSISHEAVTVVVGFDARPESLHFAVLASEVIAAQGATVLLTSTPTPTPCVAFAVRHLGASAGVVVTASHNPRGDNGYKVFDQGGVQIVAPWDEQIARRMSESPPPCDILRSIGGVRPFPEDVLDAYFETVRALAEQLVPDLGDSPNAGLKIAYTPLHGVGGAALRRAIAGWSPWLTLLAVAEQEQPDGLFPTVPFPNPEEEGVLDAAIALAEGENCDAVFAHDPDVDRFSLCLPFSSKEFVRLSGDAVGLLFLDACLASQEGKPSRVFSTIVSTPAADELASLYGATLQRTLTGFKWLCHAAAEAEDFVFAYEEALGYCFAAPKGRTTIMDKDGIAAACVMARLLRRAGSGAGLVEQLFSIYERVGQWGSFSISRRHEEVGGRERMESTLRSCRVRPPKTLGGLRVTRVEDFAEGSTERPWFLGAQDLLSFDLHAGLGSEGIKAGRVMLRPSGTEAKLKAYIHLKSEFRGSEHYQEDFLVQEALSLKISEELFSHEI